MMSSTPVPRTELPHRSSLGRMIDQSTALLMLAIGALIFLLAFLILFHENANATEGYRLRTLERERSMLLLEQEVLNMEKARAQSLEQLRDDKQIRAMVPVKGAKYVNEDVSVAKTDDQATAQ